MSALPIQFKEIAQVRVFISHAVIGFRVMISSVDPQPDFMLSFFSLVFCI
jgi:hypothetical protein